MSDADEYVRQTELEILKRRRQEIFCRDVHSVALPNLCAVAIWAAGARDWATLQATTMEPTREWDTPGDDLRKRILEQLPDVRRWLDGIEAALKSGDE
jgi:hypothetical protein